jgi:hypothetical protein
MSAPIYTITLRAERDDGVRGLRSLLKRAWRDHGLRAVEVQERPAVARRRRRGVTQARRQEKIIMDMRKFSGSAFLKVGDVRANGPLRKIIVGITEGKYGRPDLEFDDGTKLSVNATNNRTLVNAYGGESNDMLNKEIELSLGEVEYQGEMQESVIVKPISPPVERKPAPPKPSGESSTGGKPGDMDDEIPF